MPTYAAAYPSSSTWTLHLCYRLYHDLAIHYVPSIPCLCQPLPHLCGTYCRNFAAPMPQRCRTYSAPMPHPCPAAAYSSPSTCMLHRYSSPYHAPPMPHPCRTYVATMPHLCRTYVSLMPTQAYPHVCSNTYHAPPIYPIYGFTLDICLFIIYRCFGSYVDVGFEEKSRRNTHPWDRYAETKEFGWLDNGKGFLHVVEARIERK